MKTSQRLSRSTEYEYDFDADKDYLRHLTSELSIMMEFGLLRIDNQEAHALPADVMSIMRLKQDGEWLLTSPIIEPRLIAHQLKDHEFSQLNPVEAYIRCAFCSIDICCHPLVDSSHLYSVLPEKNIGFSSSLLSSYLFSLTLPNCLHLSPTPYFSHEFLVRFSSEILRHSCSRLKDSPFILFIRCREFWHLPTSNLFDPELWLAEVSGRCLDNMPLAEHLLCKMLKGDKLKTFYPSRPLHLRFIRSDGLLCVRMPYIDTDSLGAFSAWINGVRVATLELNAIRPNDNKNYCYFHGFIQPSALMEACSKSLVGQDIVIRFSGFLCNESSALGKPDGYLVNGQNLFALLSFLEAAAELREQAAS